MLMNHDLICSWLEISADNWPPNHYVLLGLKPGETDVERIEQCVHERFARLRKYQLNHPDQVTEAMNLVAQALLCLTEPQAKKAYDAVLWPPAGEVPPGRSYCWNAGSTPTYFVEACQVRNPNCAAPVSRRACRGYIVWVALPIDQ